MTRVYYLDDEHLLCEAFRKYMLLRGFDVSVFTTAKEAVECCKSAPPDVIFIDYRLTNTTGDRVAETIGSAIKKVLVTGDLLPECAELFDEVLHKPYRLSEVVALINRLSGAGG